MIIKLKKQKKKYNVKNGIIIKKHNYQQHKLRILE